MIAAILAALLQGPAPPVITTIAEGATSNVETARQVVVRTADDWTQLWKSHAPSQPPPAVDFRTTMVAAVFMGTRPTAGYRVRVTRARADAGALVVEYMETEPPRDAIAAQMLTAPFHIVAIPKRDGDVRFQKTEK